MDTILSSIKKFPSQYSAVIKMRSQTTPSTYNRENHLKLLIAIRSKEWGVVCDVLEDRSYKRPLQGVVYCLGHFGYDDIFTLEVHSEIIGLFEKGEIL